MKSNDAPAVLGDPEGAGVAVAAVEVEGRLAVARHDFDLIGELAYDAVDHRRRIEIKADDHAASEAVRAALADEHVDARRPALEDRCGQPENRRGHAPLLVELRDSAVDGRRDYAGLGRPDDVLGAERRRLYDVFAIDAGSPVEHVPVGEQQPLTRTILEDRAARADPA